MNKLILLTTLLVVIVFNYSFTTRQNPDAIIGKWYCEELDKSTFQVTKDASGVYSALIVKSADPSFVGKTAMKNVKYIAAKNHWEGTIISIKRKKELDGVFTLQANGQLKVIGSVFLISKTFFWKKLK
ncbi:DUF2147 domain-containing protein [Lacibacter sp. MH-610]|uniref:hypothetical protein n=1 Tax=Lacibacter sp. MH-610 TaxID=3020883 RepID=UPI0038916C89